MRNINYEEENVRARVRECEKEGEREQERESKKSEKERRSDGMYVHVCVRNSPLTMSTGELRVCSYVKNRCKK